MSENQKNARKRLNLPVKYDYSTKAWMTGHIFRKWLLAWDLECRSKQRKILLFLDNWSAHPEAIKNELTNITLEYLPKNTTSLFSHTYGSFLDLYVPV